MELQKYIRNERTISGRLSDEIVMMDLDQGKYYSLNPVASRIWDLLADSMSKTELCELLMAEYEVDEARCLEDLEALLSEMIGKGLVIVSS